MPRTAHHTENPAKAAAAKTPFFSGPAAPFFQAKPAEGQQEDKTGPESEQLLRMNEPAVQEAAGENTHTPFFGRSPFFAQTQSFSPVPIRQTTEAPAAKAATIRRTADESEIQWSTADAGAQVQRQPETDTLQREAAETEETVQRQESESSESPTEIQRQPDAEEAVQRRETGETGSDLQLMPDFGEGDGQVQREPDEEETVQRLESDMTEDPGDVQRQPAPETGIPAGTDAESAPAPAMNTPDNASAAPPPVSAPAIIQANLKVGAPDDRYEREADEMAEKVQRMPQKQHALPREWNPGQTGVPMFQRSEDADAEPDIQAKSDGPAPALQRSADGGLSVSSNFSSRLQTTGGGAPLPPATQQHMEGAFGADFGSVRIHTDTEAAQLSSDIGARAFTHKNDIYFNSGEYNPGSQSGQFLLAHELTHTVQQGAAVKRQPTASEEPPQVQAGFLDSLGSLLGSVRDRVVRFIRNLPGYFLISVIIGSDPITGQTVERTGMNFLRGFLLMLPGGEAKYNQLRDEGALQNAAAWMDRQIAAIASLRSRFSDAYNRSRDSLSGWDLLDPGEAFDRITGYFAPVVRDAITYAGQLVTEVLTFLKDALLSRLVNFVRDRTRAYPLLQVLLGRDPITGEEVPQTMENIIRGFLMLTEAGEDYYNKMVETGTLARATAWMREQIAQLPTRDEVVGAFTRAWESLSFADLVHPADAFERIYNILADPVGRIVNFVVNVAMEVLRLIKEALLSLLRRHANEIRGYRLMTVLLGRDPVTGEQVERNATNILSGFVELVAGPEQFRQIEESGAIARMVSWLEELVNRTGISFQMVVDLMMGIWNSVSIQDLVHPIDTFNRIVARFQDPINRVLTFIIEVIKKVIEIVLQLMNVPVDVIMQIIERAMAAYEIIKRDPIAFLMNLLRAIKLGFQQFFDNILTHLLGGLTGWLFGELEAAGVRPPTELSFRAILGFVLDVLGISMERIWQKLAEHPRIGPQRVARIRSIIDRLTGIWTIIQEVMNEGIGALWRHIEEQLSNLWTMVLDYVKNWVMEQIITQMVTRLLSMLDPTGIMAVIRSVEAFYRAVQSFIERLNEILRIVNSFVGGILEIAQGNLTTAANYLERTMAGALPTIIGFLANQIGLRGLGARIGEMIEQVRAVVDQALTWLINKVVDMGFALLDRAMSAVRSARDAVLNWLGLRKEFRGNDGRQHRLYFRGEESSAVLIVESNPTPYQDFIDTVDVGNNQEKIQAKTQALALARQIDDKKRQRLEGSTDEERENSKQQKLQEIAGLLESLKQHTAVLFGGNIPQWGAPNPGQQPQLQGVGNHGFGISMHIIPLTNINMPSGSRPDQGSHSVYDKLNLRKTRSGSASYYIRGHLLNMELGGKGDWDNMTPLTRSANSAHESIEARVKAAVNSGAIVEYRVTPDYSGTLAGKQSLLTQINNLPEDNESKRKKAEIVEAEDNLPASMAVEAYRVEQTNSGQFERRDTIANQPISNTPERSVDSYFVEGTTRPQTVLLNHELNSNKIAQVLNIDPGIATNFKNTRDIENITYRTYDQVAQALNGAVSVQSLRTLRDQGLISLGNNAQ